MIVMKFGGTSVGSAERIAGLARLVQERTNRRPVVVVSALGGVTDGLLRLLASAERGDEDGLVTGLALLRERHHSVIEGLRMPASARDRSREVVEAELAAVADAARGILLLGERTPRAVDRVCAAGELISHVMIAQALESAGLRVRAVDPRQLVITGERHGEAEPDRDATQLRAEALLVPLLREDIVPVTGGFVGATSSGRTTTLGRGGSDFSASLLAAALGAEDLEIWTDVPGMMSADPRVVPRARTLPRVSFHEAAELAYFGAKVLHPATIRPAIERAIPVRVLDSGRPELGGTLIDARGDEGPEACVRAVASKRGIATIAMDSPRMLGAHGFLARVFGVFERHATPVDVVTTSEVSVSVTIDRLGALESIERDLASFCDVRVHRDRALVCLVGRRLLENPRLVGEVLAEVHPAHLRMFCLGSSDINLTLVVDDGEAESVVRRLHARFLEA